jgi:hypothetical protein
VLDKQILLSTSKKTELRCYKIFKLGTNKKRIGLLQKKRSHILAFVQHRAGSLNKKGFGFSVSFTEEKRYVFLYSVEVRFSPLSLLSRACDLDKKRIQFFTEKKRKSVKANRTDGQLVREKRIDAASENRFERSINLKSEHREKNS